jgi:hypothetical protein
VTYKGLVESEPSPKSKPEPVPVPDPMIVAPVGVVKDGAGVMERWLEFGEADELDEELDAVSVGEVWVPDVKNLLLEDSDEVVVEDVSFKMENPVKMPRKEFS